MISVSGQYNLIISDGGYYEWQIINGANTFGISNLITGTIKSAVMEGVSIGNTIASELDFSFWGVTIDPTNPLVVKFRATDGDSNQSAWYTKGTFYIDTVEKSPYSEETKVTAFDAMLKAEVAYMETGTWTSTTDSAVVTAIASDMGVSVDSATATLLSGSPITLDNAVNIGTDGTTERELLSCIAALRGGNWVISSDNKLKLIVASTSPTNTVTVGDSVDNFDASPVETISKVEVILNPSTVYESGTSTGKTLSVSLPFYGSQSVADDLLTQFNGISFYPYTASRAFIDPKYEIGDGATYKTTDTVTSFIASQTLTLDQLAPSNTELKGEEIVNSYYPYRTAVEKAVSQEAYERMASISVMEDSIVSRVSAVEQTASNLETAMSDVQGDISSLDSQITQTSSEVTQLANGITTTITQQIGAQVPGMVQDGVDGLASIISVYMRYYLDGNNHGVLELGDADNDFIAQLTNTQLAFLQSGEAIAYLSNNKLYITEAQILTNMQIGKYKWLTDSTGRMSLKWED